nr:hypothetical protein [Prevotella pallens]
MKIELQAGDTIAIPDGCKAIVKDGNVVFEKEEFKDGDILVTIKDNKRRNAFIYKNTDLNGFHSYYVGINADGLLSVNDSSNSRWGCYDLSYATEEEKKQLFDKMKEQDLRWNAEEKRVEKLLWRADAGEEYYFINSSLKVMKIEECWSVLCSEHYSANNYFRTKEQAEEAAICIKETLRNYHEEIKE